ncbi:hypothetical protein G647_05310 [Cladophialophora carrionii CBS 160.54]|uniref:FAD-binding FR-type domain-containing protein n=1 Tax=Cladophialophora carrionii CBS 160.54 TaxID=1279043 RepID=V9DB37_9EURO|nr:uncharacterized protein G647_05310 [Cladophialophora carrionii CBS 160.54]ETI23508.1 hypothetical protein G647_05310 [Cladophialophora carrionii CBS 160.54]
MAYSMTVKLTPEQLDERRRQLDRAGFHAWLSPIVILLGVYIYRRWLAGSIPKLLCPLPARGPARGLRLCLRRVAWILSTTYVYEYGPLYVPLVGLLYTLWLVYLASRGTGEDYMHITKSLGHVAASQLPLHYLLSVKQTRYSPVTWATGMTHERLNAVHRLFGRIVHLFLAAHAVLYLRFFVTMGFLERRIKDRDVRLGVLAFWSFNLLGILSLPVVRRRVYLAVFYRSHVLLSAVVLAVLWFHVPYTRWFVGQAGAIYLLGAFLRVRGARKIDAMKCRAIAIGTRGTGTGTGTSKELLIQVNFRVAAGDPLAVAMPGQHVYLVRNGVAGPKTPATIANVQRGTSSLSKSNVEIMLVLRDMGGPGTSYLAALCSQSARKGLVAEDVRVEGPYGEASEYMPAFLGSGSSSDSKSRSSRNGPILLVAGGIGVTYTLPIYLSLLACPSNQRRKIKFIYLTKTLREAQWVVDLLLGALNAGVADALDVEIYATRSVPDPIEGGGLDAAALRSPFLRAKGVKVEDLRRRPDLRESVDEVFTATPDKDTMAALDLWSTKAMDGGRDVSFDSSVSVFVCGPSGLSRHVRGLVGRWVWRDGRSVNWYEEVFAFGGS